MWSSVVQQVSGLTSHLSIVLLVSVVVVYWARWRNSRIVRLVSRIPGPKGLPFIGNILDAACQPTEWLLKCMVHWVRRYGPIYKGWIGGHPVVVISSPELMEPILTSQRQIAKADEYSFLRLWLGDCMFLTTGDRWRTRRRLLTPAFHFQILNSFFDVFNERSQQLVADLARRAQQQPGQAFDVFPVMGKCALDIVCETSMGKQAVSSQESEGYFNSLHRFTRLVQQRAERPWLRSDWIFRMSPLGRESQRCVDDLHRFTSRVIRDRRERINASKSLEEACLGNNNETQDDTYTPKERLAFLDLLLAAAANRAELSDDDIREEVDTVMFAGHDTTAMAMTWFLHCVSKHPEVQRKLLDEVDAIFGDSDRPCTPQDVTRMKYLECCAKETLRLYPSVPGILRNLTEDVNIGKYTIPAGASVALMIYGMHHHPDIYPEPEEYKPERFLPENCVGRHPYAFIPFSAGPRNCIGQKYGMIEIKVVLSTLLRHFRFSCPDADDGKLQIPQAHIVLKPARPVDVIVHLRDKS
nr:CYP4BY5 protein [Diaphanosoma celebensis]